MMRIAKPAAALVIGTMLLAGVTACDSEDTSTYDVTVSWNIGGLPSCESPPLPGSADTLVFDTVVITVYEAEGEAEPIQEPVEVPCDDLEYTITRLSRGSYWVTLGAMATYDGDTLPYFQAEGEIDAPAEDDAAYDFPLTLGSGEVEVSWGFAQGVCGANGVEEVIVSMSTQSDPIPCDEGQYLIEDLTWNNYNLTIEGYNADGDLTHEGSFDSNPFEVKPGMRYEAYVQLDEI